MKGKEKCEFLKGIRKRMAEANGIPYEARECTYKGECTGTCPFCEKEAAELMAKLRIKEAEGTEIKKDDVGILAIKLGINERHGTDKDKNDEVVIKCAELATLIEQDMNMVKKQLPGRLMNPYDEDTNIPELPIDSFRGSNNLFMSRKDLNELRQYKQREREPYMGDNPYPYFGMSEEDDETKALLQEEEERTKRERKGKGIINRLIASIKRHTALQGDLEE